MSEDTKQLGLAYIARGKRIEELGKEIERLRLERDMLGLNRYAKDPVVFVVTDPAGEVVGVTWKNPQQRTGTDRAIRFPSYVTAKENHESRAT